MSSLRIGDTVAHDERHDVVQSVINGRLLLEDSRFSVWNSSGARTLFIFQLGTALLAVLVLTRYILDFCLINGALC